VLDSDGRARFQLQAVNVHQVRISEQQFDDNGNVTAVIRYAELASASALQALLADGLSVDEARSLIAGNESS
jgi:hypothetical protein